MGKNTLVIGLIMLVVGLGVGYAFGGDRGPIAGTHVMPGGAMMGNNIDQHFIVQMIPHHEMAVIMAQMLASGTERPEMKQLADNIIASQSREIEMMRSWLTSWY